MNRPTYLPPRSVELSLEPAGLLAGSEKDEPVTDQSTSFGTVSGSESEGGHPIWGD